MRTYQANTLQLPGCVVTIGAFDGVHIGHQAIIGQVLKRAALLNVPAVVYTFDPPPRNYFQNIRVLTDIEEKLRRLSILRVDYTIVAQFNAQYTLRDKTDFIEELSLLNPREVWVGPDFRFGRGRQGGIADLSEHFSVKIIEKVCCSDGQIISSTRVRELVAAGAALEAKSLLGW